MADDPRFEWHRGVARHFSHNLQQRRFWLWISAEPAGVGVDQVDHVAKVIAREVDEWLAQLGDPAAHQSTTGTTLTDGGVDVKIEAFGKRDGAPDDPVVGNPERAYAYFVA